MTPTTITQIIYLRIPPDKPLNQDPSGYYGKLWSSALDVIEKSEGFQRVYWGRSLEVPENVQIHTVRPTIEHHRRFISSTAFSELVAILETLSGSASTNPIQAIRHAAMTEWTPNCKALAKGAPYTGTAIYLRPTAAWNEGAWPLWTHLVRDKDGCMGCAGGPILESVDLLGEPTLVGEGATEADKALAKGDGKDGKGGLGRFGKWDAYLVYVGWETTEKHEAVHHTKFFKEHAVVLRCGNAGFAEYGHICFEGERVGSQSRL